MAHAHLLAHLAYRENDRIEVVSFGIYSEDAQHITNIGHSGCFATVLSVEGATYAEAREVLIAFAKRAFPQIIRHLDEVV